MAIGDLANYDTSILAEKLGVVGIQLYLSAHGIDNNEVMERWERKSMSREVIFEEDTSDYAFILDTLDTLSEDLHKQPTTSNFAFKTITEKMGYEDFVTHTHGKTLPVFTHQNEDTKKSARDLVQNLLHNEQNIRQIGVKLSNLFSTKKQTSLSDLPDSKNKLFCKHFPILFTNLIGKTQKEENLFV